MAPGSRARRPRLGEDALDQRQIMAGPGAPPLGHHSGCWPAVWRLLAVQPGWHGWRPSARGRAGASCPCRGCTRSLAPSSLAMRRRSRHGVAGAPSNAPACRSSRVMTRTASHSCALSLGWCISAALTVLSIRTMTPLSSFSCWALATNARLTASQVCGRIALIVRCSTDFLRRPGQRQSCKGPKQVVKGWCRLGQNTSTQPPLIRLVIMALS
jgi:hypothetical protein